jgi:hypothetical protein
MGNEKVGDKELMFFLTDYGFSALYFVFKKKSTSHYDVGRLV